MKAGPINGSSSPFDLWGASKCSSTLVVKKKTIGTAEIPGFMRRHNDRLRIAMIGTRGMPANYGGVETVVDVLARELVARGHEVTVFCRSEDYDHHPPMLDGVHLVYLPASASPGVGAMLHAFRATIWTIGRGFDIIHFHALGPGLMSIIARLFTRATVIITVHGRDDKRDKWGRGLAPSFAWLRP